MTEPKTINLPSGKTATLRPGKGRDLMNAQRVTRGDSSAMTLALVAQLATIDGHPVVYEDLLEMDLLDVAALQAAMMEENFAGTVQAGGSPSPSDAGSDTPS